MVVSVLRGMVVPVVGIVLGFGVAFASFHARGRMPISPSVARMDVGTIEAGDVFVKTITLRNLSDRPFRLDEVGTSCGCTTTTPVSVIAPHSEAPLTVRFDSSGRNGAIRQAILLRAGGETLSVPLIGTVVQNYRLSADAVEMTSGKEATVILSRRDGKSITLSSVETPGGIVATRTAFATDTVRVGLRRAPNSGTQPVGQYTEPVRLHLGGDLPAILTVAASWTIPSRYSVAPTLLNLGSVKPQSTTTRTVTVSGVGASHLCIENAPTGFTAKVAPQGANRATITVSGTVTTAVLHDALILATGNASEPRLRIPLVAVLDTDSGEAACLAH